VTGSRLVFHEIADSPGGARSLAVTLDGSVWCVQGAAGVVVRIAPDGGQTRIRLGAGAADPHSVAAATRDSVWVTDRASGRILRLESSGVVWSAEAPTTDAGLAGIVGLDDGSAWFAEEKADALGHVDILGRVSEFDTGVPGGGPASLASDGSSVWFALPGAGAIAHVRGGDSLPGLVGFDDPRAAPRDVAVGDDGCLWFADPARRLIGRVARNRSVAEFPLSEEAARPTNVAADGIGGCWFTMSGAAELGRVDDTGRVTTIPLPSELGAVAAIAVAPAGGVWLAVESGVLEIGHRGSLAADIQ
jgi:virginiamycin B lyase